MDQTFKRRDFFELMGRGAAALSVAGLTGCAPEAGESRDEPALERDEELTMDRDAPGQHIAMLLYPGLTLLDLIGPHTCFQALGMTVHLVWKSRAPITSDSGITILPTSTFAQCPRNLEILFVPGSSTGTAAVIRDPDALRFVRSRGERAKLVTSVCTGSLILGAAGLLRGYRATSHWSTRDLLPILEAERVDARYVQDRNRITGAGVTSGIDFGLRVVEQLRGRTAAELVQLMIEYAPEPPFDAGEPDTAPAAVVAAVLGLWALPLTDARAAVETARANF